MDPPPAHNATDPMETRMATPPCPVDAEFLKQFAEAWNRHDIDALTTFMAEDCRFHAVAGPALYGRSFVGRDAVRTAFAAPRCRSPR